MLGRLQRRVFAAILRWDVTSLQAMGTGAVTARVTGDVEATHSAVAEVFNILLWYLARGVCLLVTMAWLSPHLAFVTLLSLPVLLLLPRGIGKIQQVPGGGHIIWVLCPLHVFTVPFVHPLSPPCACCPLHLPTTLSLCALSPRCAPCHLPMPIVPSLCPRPLAAPLVTSTCPLSPPHPRSPLPTPPSPLLCAHWP